MSYEDKIKELKLELPEARDPVGSYVASKQIGKMLFISGQISIAANGELIKGKIGKDLKTEDGYEAAKRCGLNIISQVKKACGDDLSKVKSCIKLTGFVNSTEDFYRTTQSNKWCFRFNSFSFWRLWNAYKSCR
jgi:enamine deaminase RidA (YjgF/YER057c/UK114 family)